MPFLLDQAVETAAGIVCSSLLDTDLTVLFGPRGERGYCHCPEAGGYVGIVEHATCKFRTWSGESIRNAFVAGSGALLHSGRQISSLLVA